MALTYPIELLGRRVRLVEPTVEMAPRIWKMHRREEEIFGPPGLAETEHELRRQLGLYAEHARSGDRVRYRWAVERRDTGELIGSARCHIEDRLAGVGSIGYGLSSAQRGSGFGTEAASLAVAFGFEELELHRIWATIEPGNEPSIRLIQRLGFHREGPLAKRIRVADDDRRAAYLFVLTRDGWRARVG